jgi:hypothetical protein
MEQQHRPRTGDEPTHARSPLRMRLVLAFVGLLNGLAGVGIFGFWLRTLPFLVLFAALTLVSLVNIAYKAEYIWIDGTEPTAQAALRRPRSWPTAAAVEPPIWGFDGSSTNQAEGPRAPTACSSRSSPVPTRSAAATTSWCCARCWC